MQVLAGGQGKVQQTNGLGFGDQMGRPLQRLGLIAGSFFEMQTQFHRAVKLKDLTSPKAVLQYRKIRRMCPFFAGRSGFMTAKSPLSSPNAKPKEPCKHPRVQIVSRDEESEFVECKECGEIFESSEFKDMNIEERTEEEI